jgi:hypothetical protein
MEFTESGLRFVFDETKWSIITPFDLEKDYQNVKNSLSGTKSVDFIGTGKDTTCLFEIKSFRGYRDQESVQGRLANGADDLTTEVAQKVRDTLSCLLAGARNSTNKNQEWKKICNTIMDAKHQRLLIIAWVEEDFETNTSQKRIKVKMGIRKEKLKKKLSWLSKRVFIMNIKEYNGYFDGLSVSYPTKERIIPYVSIPVRSYRY